MTRPKAVEILKSQPTATLQRLLKWKRSLLRWLEREHPAELVEIAEQQDAIGAIESELFVRRGSQ
jgi:hypothetical protein